MKSPKSYLFLLALLLVQYSFAQTQIFHDLSLSSSLYEKEKWQANVTALWKRFDSGQPKWDRFGASVDLRFKHKPWTVIGGLRTTYELHKDADNFFEIRPWLGINISIPIFGELAFKQRFKSERRFFMYPNSDVSAENYSRNRIKPSLYYVFAKNPDKGTNWSIEGGIEWYILQEPATGERFSNTREFSVELGHTFANGQVLTFSYVHEQFNTLFNDTGKSGHTLGINFRP